MIGIACFIISLTAAEYGFIRLLTVKTERDLWVGKWFGYTGTAAVFACTFLFDLP